MTSPKPKSEQKPLTEEIEWTDEDDEIMDKVMAKLRAKGVKADPVHPVKKKGQDEDGGDKGIVGR